MLKDRIVGDLNVGIYVPHRFYAAMEAVAIQTGRVLNLDIKNIRNERLETHVKGYNSSRFVCVLVVMVMEMVQQPLAVKITTNEHINKTHSLVREFERFAMIEPYVRFVFTSINSQK